MARNSIPTYTTGDLITAAHGNTYWRDNEAAHWSIISKKTVYLSVVPSGETLAVGNGKLFFTVPEVLDGATLTSINAAIYTASTSGLPSVCLHNLTDAVDMLSANVTIDVNELSSYTATTPATIDGANDTVSKGDILRVDIDAKGTGAKGLDLDLEFTLP